jgi:polysaccharide export outer membrane protein
MNYLFLFSAFAISSSVLMAQQPSTSLNADQQSPTMVYNLPSQTVGVDDLLAISVYDSPELTRTVRVDSDGEIRLPMLTGKISVQGKFCNEIESAIANELTKQGILVDPIVSVSVAEYKSRPISVVGAVKNPLTFQALPNTTLLDAIARAQGLTDTAGSYIILTRHLSNSTDPDAVVTKRISVKALLESPEPIDNVLLSGGEVVRVPEAGQIFVVGNVKKPGAFSVHETRDATVLKAIAMSEGLDQYSAKVAYIYRPELGTGVKAEIPIELSNIMDRKTPDVPLQPNDILYIPDNKTKKFALSTLARLLMLGTAATPAVIYSSR